MGDKSKIEWTDATWNPVTGCTKVSQGCKNCYAERMFKRPYPKREFTDVQCHPERLDQPLHWKKPRRIFVNSMSDLFHESVPDIFIVQAFQTMAAATWHTFQILTKRPKRMHEMMVSFHWRNDELGGEPLPNVHLGVSCEDQATADERIPLLLQTPAAVRFISAEPLLGPVKLKWDWVSQGKPLGGGPQCNMLRPWEEPQKLPALAWVICGGESGPNARPMNIQWARDIVAQCQAAGVPVFVKQLGANPIVEKWPKADREFSNFGRVADLPLKHKKGGDWDEWPKDLRVREFPITT